ncbi:MAG TPA: undecaprenyl-diphosphate phosphatase [Polyangiaceae bacterium]|nr:undecaprenyl-diphosphate phosphatase [Polyangiaceae bacterium]
MLPDLVKALVLGVVEGLTEFLPISSTGHLILAGALLDFDGEKAKVFEIVIQTGAVLAVVWEYRARFTKVLGGLGGDPLARRFALNILIAFMPAAVLGLLLGKHIKELFFRPIVVALAFILGALVILWAERRKHTTRIENVDDMTPWDALRIGAAQTLALIPGTSRSGATIIGGLFVGLSRKAAAEFSFFLAVPTLIAAAAYDAFKHRALFTAADAGIFGVGTISAFVSGFLCVRWLLRYVSRHDFTAFAWYRIAFGLVVLATAFTGLVRWS